MNDKFLQGLSQNLLRILDDDEYYDMIIEVGNDPYIKIFRAHMVILNYRSNYLRRMLSTNKKKNDGTLVQIKLPNILPETFQTILRYIYGGTLSLEDYDTPDVVKILVAAGELNLHELIAYSQCFLIKNKTQWMEQNFNLIYKTSFENDSFLELQEYCTDVISKIPDKLFKSLDHSSVPEKLVISLIQNDNLQMSEIQVWENVIKWGLAQNPELSSDPSNYSKNDFNSLKNALQHCIPFIKFSNITFKEFSDSVLPYKEVLPEELFVDLLRNFLNLHPDSKLNHKPKTQMAKKTYCSVSTPTLPRFKPYYPGSSTININPQKQNITKEVIDPSSTQLQPLPKNLNNKEPSPKNLNDKALLSKNLNNKEQLPKNLNNKEKKVSFVKFNEHIYHKGIGKNGNNEVLSKYNCEILKFITNYVNLFIKQLAVPKLNSHFIEDVNVPDGTTFIPQTQFIKTWKMSNNGCISWPDSTVLRCINGDRMFNEVVPKVPIGSIGVGEDICISVNLQAPSELGKYVSSV
ncbi:hypothetical protein RclHR1_07850006 [Rhizophagus clarus]|uniref:BTB domain-containing protein n=1 Tax=Rhizophagus clarus TaxID=94130 RepID=A0A2Z6RYN6_9GLOM|nr:hypothetical protein RclHR1_07850006 [Rhizophagus clarus]